MADKWQRIGWWLLIAFLVVIALPGLLFFLGTSLGILTFDMGHGETPYEEPNRAKSISDAIESNTVSAATPSKPPLSSSDGSEPSQNSSHSAGECDYPKLRHGLSRKVCNFEADELENRAKGTGRQPWEPVQHIPVYVDIVDGAEPREVRRWLTSRDQSSKIRLRHNEEQGYWTIVWNAPISLIGELSIHPDVRQVWELPQLQPEREPR